MIYKSLNILFFIENISKLQNISKTHHFTYHNNLLFNIIRSTRVSFKKLNSENLKIKAFIYFNYMFNHKKYYFLEFINNKNCMGWFTNLFKNPNRRKMFDMFETILNLNFIEYLSKFNSSCTRISFIKNYIKFSKKIAYHNFLSLYSGFKIHLYSPKSNSTQRVFNETPSFLNYAVGETVGSFIRSFFKNKNIVEMPSSYRSIFSNLPEK